MSGRWFLVVAALCAVYLAVRAATQPASFDFDESAHLGTIIQVRKFGGLAPAELFPDVILVPGTIEPRFHAFPPLPYLLMAGVTAVGQTEPTSAGVLGVARAFSALLAAATVVSAGIAARNLRRAGLGLGSHESESPGWERGDSWTAAVVVTAGLTLMPGLHSMGASATASIWALAGVGLTTAATTWAVRRGWSRGSTLTVAACVAFVVAARASAYPVLLLVPLAMLAARLSPRAAALRLGLIAAVVAAVNAWWLVRSGLVTGDPLGASIYLATVSDAGHCNIARESPEWCRAASGPWPAWSLLTSTDLFWVYLSRMLVRKTWIDPLTLGLWFSMVLVPIAAVVAARVRRDRAAVAPFLPFVAASGVVMSAIAFWLAVTLAAGMGWSIYARDTFIASIPLVVAVAALADLRQDRLRTVLFGSGLAFAAAANAGFMLAVLS